MASSLSRLPSRFPVGTKFVIEGRRGSKGQQVYSRHIEFPDGTLFPLPARPMARSDQGKTAVTGDRWRRARMRRQRAVG
jgi:hypothetical protein